jgi:uncharacterized protein YjbI with pentapeptide repeats
VGLQTRPQSEGRSATDAKKPTPVEVWPTPAVSPVAAKADDLEAIKKAVDDAAAVGGGLWLSYLFVLFYLAIAAGAVTHADLFFEKPVKLPFLNIELPLLAFFFVAPILFLVVHAYVLVHLVMLTDKAKRFHEAVHDAGRNVDPTRRENLQWQLPSNIFIQFLVGPSKIRRGLFGSALRAIAWITLVIAPILLLLLMQVQFLPFHSLFITWTQRIALLIDLILLAWLWPKVLSGRELGGPFRASWAWPVIGFAFSLAVLLFSWASATFPGEWQEELLSTWRFTAVSDATEQAKDEPSEPEVRSLGNWVVPFWAGWAANRVLANAVSLHDWLFNSEVDDTTRRRRLPFSNTLVLTGLNIYEGLGIDDPEKNKGRDFVFRARGRDLRGAIFALASLPKVDFEGADLQGAFLDGAQLRGASLNGAQLQGASLDGAQLQDASLDGAQLQAANLRDAQLQHASLRCKPLQDGERICVQLQGADLYHAHLQGTSLEDALLQGAVLTSADLQGASLNRARLQGATLGYAQLQGASLNHTYLNGASLEGARLEAALLDSAQLQGASLKIAHLQGASLKQASLEGTDLSDVFLWRSGGAPYIRMILFSESGNTWSPVAKEGGEVQPWGVAEYDRLRKTLESLPAGELRDQALERIKVLDCPNPDPALASCDPPGASVPPLEPPPEAAALRKSLEEEAAHTNETKDYPGALAKSLRDLVCPGDDNAIHVVRGEGFRSRLLEAGDAAFGLIRELTNKDSEDCPVAASLTDADRAALP